MPPVSRSYLEIILCLVTYITASYCIIDNNLIYNCNAQNEIKSWYENAGFTDVHKVDLDSGLAQMIGVKK